MHINGATPGSPAWVIGETLQQGGFGGDQAASATLGNAIVNGFDDKDAGGLTAVAASFGFAIGGPYGAAIGGAIGYAISGLVGGANDNANNTTISGNNGYGALAHGKPA